MNPTTISSNHFGAAPESNLVTNLNIYSGIVHMDCIILDAVWGTPSQIKHLIGTRRVCGNAEMANVEAVQKFQGDSTEIGEDCRSRAGSAFALDPSVNAEQGQVRMGL
ncbi:hypothetical protein N7454_001764 [Penicillium verhagenii]|nr:hypothetical protein N7454_001764 [Penicillium verhagenii]